MNQNFYLVSLMIDLMRLFRALQTVHNQHKLDTYKHGRTRANFSGRTSPNGLPLESQHSRKFVADATLSEWCPAETLRAMRFEVCMFFLTKAAIIPGNHISEGNLRHQSVFPCFTAPLISTVRKP